MAKAWGEGKEDLEEVGEDVTCYVVIDCSLINPGEGPMSIFEENLKSKEQEAKQRKLCWCFENETERSTGKPAV